jgi:holo-[acyl-carrier protein] synthase
VGIDIVDIARVKKAIVRTPRFLERLYTRQELDYCLQKANPYPSLAARFAAREAFYKLDGTLHGLKFHDVEVAVREGGQPYLLLQPEALLKTAKLGIKEISLSLSHAKEQAIAIVIADRE